MTKIINSSWELEDVQVISEDMTDEQAREFLSSLEARRASEAVSAYGMQALQTALDEWLKDQS